MNKTIFVILCSLSSFMLMSLSKPQNMKSSVTYSINSVEREYIVDKRLQVFNISFHLGETPEVKGEISNKEAYKALIKQLNEFDNLKISIRLLPDRAVGDKKYGVVKLPIATIRKKPQFSSEMVSQALMGSPVKVLDRKDNWSLVQTPEGYIGWTSKSIHFMNDEELSFYNQKEKLIVTSFYSFIYSEPVLESSIISNVMLANTITVKGELDDFFNVVLPDHREGYILKSDVAYFNIWLSSCSHLSSNIVEVATRFIGVPYLWGGVSSSGVDCSGFTKLVYFMNGVILPRDASQQARCGVTIDVSEGPVNLRQGDLLFFGIKSRRKDKQNTITHVGIYIGDNKFIHSSGRVTVASLLSSDADYDAFNAKRLLSAVRLSEALSCEAHKIVDNPLYKK